MTEQFLHDEARKHYEEFPANLSIEDWTKILGGMVTRLDELAEAGDLPWRATAVARKARDVLLATLTDEKLPRLMAALLDCEPLFRELKGRAQRNLMDGVDPERAIAANGMLTRLEKAIEAITKGG